MPAHTPGSPPTAVASAVFTVPEIGGNTEATSKPEGGLARAPSPALFLALAFALGAAAAGSGQVSPHQLFRSIPLVAVAAAACLLAATALLGAERDRLAAGVALAGFVLAGALASLLFGFRFSPDHISHLESWGIDLATPLSVEGSLATGCVITPAGCEFDMEVTDLSQSVNALERRSASGSMEIPS